MINSYVTKEDAEAYFQAQESKTDIERLVDLINILLWHRDVYEAAEKAIDRYTTFVGRRTNG